MWSGTDSCGEGGSSKKMKLVDDQDKQTDKLKEEERCLTDEEKVCEKEASEQVVEKLEEKDDVGDLLGKKREAEVVLPKVFEILGKYFNDMENKDESDDETDTKSIPWKQPEGQDQPRPMTEFWKFRRVCKAWNQAIEELHWNEDAGHLFILEEAFAKNFLLVENWRDETFKTEAEVDKFLAHFEKTHYDSVSGKSKKNPFLGRSVKVVFPNPPVQSDQVESFQAYFNKFIDMLGKYGEEVLYFKLHCLSEGSDVGYVFWYRKLIDIIKLLPNLKALEIQLAFRSEEEEKVLIQEIGKNPFPTLLKLELLSAINVPGPFRNHLINKNRHISALNVKSDNLGEKIGNCEIFTDNLPNLTRLHFQVNSIEDLEMFENYNFGPLKLVEFGFEFNDSLSFIPWSHCLEVIGSKLTSDLCKYLSLQLPTPKNDSERSLVLHDSLNSTLELTKVRFLWCLNPKARYGLDFILPSEFTLEGIDLSCNPDYVHEDHEDYRDQQYFGFFGFEDNLDESSFLEDLPRLKYLQVAGRESKVYFK